MAAPKEDSKKDLSLRDFGGMNTQPDRKMIGEEEFSWLENVMPIGHGNMRAVPAPSAALATLPAGEICRAAGGAALADRGVALFLCELERLLSAAAAGPQGVQDYITALYGDPILGSVAARMKPLDVAVKENLAAYQADPKNWVAAHSNINGEQILNTLKGTSQTTNFGGTSQQQTIDAFGRPVAGTQVSTTMTPTPGEISTARTAAASLEQAAQIASRPVFSEGAGGYIPQYPVGAGAARTGAVAAPQVPGAAPQAPGATPPGLIPLPGVIGTTRANQAERIRGDIDKAVKPLDDMQQRLTGIQQLLATGTPLANTQIQQALTGVMNDARPYGNLMKENENFGDLQGRVSGFFSQKFAGTYSDEQRRQIQQMVTDLQNKVVTPVRDRIVQQQQNIGAAMNIPASLLPAPVGYGNSAAVPTATGPNGAKLYLRGGQWVNQ